MSYRKKWEKYYGEIPKDENGLTYDIHHIDGNRKNNNIENLKAVSLKEHYEIHFKQGDFFGASALLKRLNNELSLTGWTHNDEIKKKIGDSNRGKKRTEEQKKKLSQSLKGKPKSIRTETHRLNISKSLIDKKRKPLSDESKEKIREFQKKKIFSEETKKKISKSLLGKKRTVESIENQRKKLIGKKHSEETKKKMSIKHHGGKLSEETKFKISQSKKGIKFSNEHKNNLSISQKGKKRMDLLGSKNPMAKKVVQIDKNTDEIIMVYDTITEATQKTGINNISNVCQNKTKSAGGFKWRYYN